MYSLATLNNSFEANLNPVIGSLDSYGMSIIMSVFMMVSIGSVSTNMPAMFLLMLLSAPFVFDGAISVAT